jgi:uncharacterized protein (DUF1697 family)
MKDLKAHLEGLGYKNVFTYINSGNLIFTSDELIKDTEEQIFLLIQKAFGVSSKVLVILKEKFLDIAAHIPGHFENNQGFKADVLFYYPDLDVALVDKLSFRDGIDHYLKLDDALIHGTKRIHQTKSALIKIVGTPLYYGVTIRNVNTVRKLRDILISNY